MVSTIRKTNPKLTPSQIANNQTKKPSTRTNWAPQDLAKKPKNSQTNGEKR